VFHKKIVVYKVWSKVIGVGESIGAVSFLNFFEINVFTQRIGFFTKEIVFYKVWPKVFEIEKPIGIASFSIYW
jgi:hypothetical protein